MKRKKPLPKQSDLDARERKCIATGDIGSPAGYVRFVLSPDGVVTPDFSETLPGRGGWVVARRDAVDAAIKKGAFARSFKSKADAPTDLGARVEAGLTKNALNALGLARKAGKVTTGFEKVRAALKAKDIAVLVAANGAAADGREKLKRNAGRAAIVDVFSEQELSAALGRDGVVHAAVEAGAAAMRFLREARRVEGFRCQPESAA